VNTENFSEVFSQWKKFSSRFLKAGFDETVLEIKNPDVFHFSEIDRQ
jgi:hypothetical protein